MNTKSETGPQRLMLRAIDQWRGCDPRVMTTMSSAAIQFAFMDAKHDILALYAEVERLNAIAKAGGAS